MSTEGQSQRSGTSAIRGANCGGGGDRSAPPLAGAVFTFNISRPPVLAGGGTPAQTQTPPLACASLHRWRPDCAACMPLPILQIWRHASDAVPLIPCIWRRPQSWRRTQTWRRGDEIGRNVSALAHGPNIGGKRRWLARAHATCRSRTP